MDKGRGKWKPGPGCLFWGVLVAGLLAWSVLVGLGWLLLKAGI